MTYEVYLYNIPKVSEDGTQAIPIPDPDKRVDFAEIEEARKYAVEHKDKFDRVVLLQKDDEGQKMIERYSDGMFEKAEDIVRR